MTSNKASSSSSAAMTEMECGTSLAEDAWAVPSIAAAASTIASNNAGGNNNSRGGGHDGASSSSLSVEDAWAKIHQLRSKLAADVISDPPPPSSSSSSSSDNNGDNNPYNFPTFISPYEPPPSSPANNNKNNKNNSSKKTHKGMTIPLIYCDQTASQRPVRSIEDYIRCTSMPCHANTHTNITYTGSQSTAFVSEARQIVGECTNARITGKAALDTVIFGGNGVTGAVSILVDCLNLRGVVVADDNNQQQQLRPVVFVGPHEHHSNLLPWRESGCEVITIPERPVDGMVDVDELERLLQLHSNYNKKKNQQQQSSLGGLGQRQQRLCMGAFSAVSNVTGIIANVDEIAIVLHRYGALAFFDYASGAPYTKMDMNPSSSAIVAVAGSGDGSGDDGLLVDPSKDAIYFSPHKCYGGTSTPGVLVIKKHLISQTNPPTISGGGTVFYVTNQDHRFLSNRIERYEGGTPDGIGVQRVGLALLAGRRVANEYERIVQSVVMMDEKKKNNGSGDEMRVVTKKSPPPPPKTLLEYECSTYDRVVADLKKHAPNLIMLGCTNDNNENNDTQGSPSSCVGRHLPIFSFLIRCGKRFLHYNYVCAILNDMFGIQSRGGCQCAGPYSQRLLGLTTINNNAMEVPNEANRQIERALLRSDRPCELLRPGYTRLSLPFKGLREEEVDYVIEALIWVSKNGWMLLPQYRCDHRTGEWRHWSRRGKPLGKSERRWLSHYDVLAPTSKQIIGNDASRSMVAKGDDYSTPMLFSENMKASQARLDLSMENANAILEAAKKDPRFLSEVERMNSANGMLGSGGSNDAGEGGVDDTLEDLRWYVYQQEVSQYLRDGLEEVPDTMVDEALMGAIHVRMDGERKNSNSDGSARNKKLVPKVNGSSNVLPLVKETDSLPKSDLIPFQEGDHAGEAPYDEIKAGYDDGELSDECKVFSNVQDTWVPILDFLREDEEAAGGGILPDGMVASCRKRDLSTMVEDSPSEGINSMKIDSVPADDMDASPTPTKEATNILPAAAEKREKKKPSRDSSQWGQSSAPHLGGNHIGNAKKSVAAGSSDVVSTTTPSEEGATSASQWDMIQEGDRLLLGLSGGKDSLSLLHCLLEFQRKLPIKFDIEVCTIDPMTPSFDPSPLIPYVESLGLKYHYIRDDIVERANSSGADGKTVSSLCAFCARMKRGNLYTCARTNNCNKLVLAQHLDDCAESFLMSVMHNGFIRTMKANYQINAGDVSVIRPLVYCRESLMTEFAKSAQLPVINENCPACFEEPKERARVKKLLSREETLYPNLYDHIRRALIPVMHDDSTSIMRSYLEDTIAKSRKVPRKSKKAKTTNGSNEMELKSTAALPITNGSNEALVQNSGTSLASASEEDLIAELARRRAAKHKLSGAMKRLPGDGDAANNNLPEDATGQMCSLTGGDGMIPCRELME
ncbi:hypothetical protein ACHAXR_013290 [Thalassiosira sp. AJA248-18]